MAHKTTGMTWILLSIGVLLFFGCGGERVTYDLVIRGGFVIDGSGRPGVQTDIGIRGDRITKLGQVDAAGDVPVLDADGLVVSPGFIDIHTHCDRGIIRVPTVDNYLLQGVTTVVGGNCGGHPFPLGELFREIEVKGISPNFGCLIGHNTIRRQVMEYRMEAPSDAEMERMRELIGQEMRAGGLGFSTGLSYLPGRYSDENELIGLAEAVAPFGGIYATHLRDQGEQITEAIEEAIAVGERNGITVQISHIKLAEDSIWGRLEMITRPVEAARGRGLDVYLDQYPYTATSSGFTSSFPAWAFEGGRQDFLTRLQNVADRARIKAHVIQRRLTSARGIDKLATIFIANYSKNPAYNGRNLKDILLERGIEPTPRNGAELIIEIEREGGASGVFFQMDEDDVAELMRLPYNMHASDGGIQVPGRGMPHPRNYGTFARIISRYVREQKILPLEEAIRKMTTLPAEVFRLKDRGAIEEGGFADLTIFDPESFGDNATFSDPHQYSRGLHYVIVNGVIVVQDNAHTGALPGMVLYGPGKQQGATTQ